MSEINKILEDESNNDKELIRELSVYVKNHRDKGLPINRKFVNDVTSIVLRNSEIECNGVVLSDYGLACWDEEEKIVELNLTTVLEYSKWIKKISLKSKTGDNKIFAYYETIATIIHELTHARQYYIAKNNGKDIYDSGNTLLYEHNDVYKKHHDESFNERYANLRENVIAYQVMSYIYPSKYVSQLRYEILYYLLYGYKVDNIDEIVDALSAKSVNGDSKIISALDNYNAILEENSIDTIRIEQTEDMTLYDRLYLGLQISLDEYKSLINLWKKLHFEEGNVKKLVNRL